MSAYQQMNPVAGEGDYWVGGVEFTIRENFARDLNQREGSKSSDENSFLYKQFWKRLTNARGKVLNEDQSTDKK